MLGPQHPLHDEVRRLTAERDEAEATIATLRGEVEQAKLEATGAYNLFPPLLQAIDVAINGPTTDVMCGYTTLPQQVATLREQLTSTQQILRDAYAEAAAAGTWVEADLPTMVRSLVQQVTTLREQLQAAQAPCMCCREVTQPCQHGCRCSTPESDEGEAQR